MTDAEKLKDLETQLQACDESIEKQTSDVDEQKALMKQCSNARRDAEVALAEAVEATEREAHKNREMLHALAQEKLRATELKDQWNALKRKMAIDELYAKQPVVWDVLPKRIRVHQEATDSNFVEIDEKPVDVDELVASWKQSEQSGRPNFSHWHIDFRQMITSYQTAMKKVCELSVDKHEIPLNVRQQPNAVIDHWLKLPQVMKTWAR